MADLSSALNPADAFAKGRADALNDRQPPMAQLRAIVACLRGPGGCPWDIDQTHASLRAGLLEEAYEVVEAINQQDDVNLCEELGDLLLQPIFHAQIAAEAGRFDFEDVARGIIQKLIRRHPHVFGQDHCTDADAVLKRWDEIKQKEKGGTVAESALDGIPGGLPALLRAQKTQKKAAQIGFDWAEVSPVLEKIREEVAEIESAINSGDAAAIEDEIGDLLFSAVNLARKLHVDAETALHGATVKFSSRLRKVETLARKRGLPLAGQTLAQLDLLWEEAKLQEEKPPIPAAP